MAEQLQITFRHMTSSDSLRALAEEKFGKLQAHYPDVLGCHVVVDQGSSPRHRKGGEYAIRVEVTLGRDHVRVSAESSRTDAYAGMREAFESVSRQIETCLERRAS